MKPIGWRNYSQWKGEKQMAGETQGLLEVEAGLAMIFGALIGILLLLAEIRDLLKSKATEGE